MNITDTDQVKAKSLDQATVLPGREVLITHYNKIRNFTETLCEPLVTEDYVIQSMPDVSPTKWHLGHTSWCSY